MGNDWGKKQKITGSRRYPYLRRLLSSASWAGLSMASAWAIASLYDMNTPPYLNGIIAEHEALLEAELAGLDPILGGLPLRPNDPADQLQSAGDLR